MTVRDLALYLCIVMFCFIGCSKPSHQVVEIKKFSIDRIITQSIAEFDNADSGDGLGSIKIKTTEPTVVRLFETGDIDIENASLIYQAKVKTEGIEGKVFLEMWVHFPGKGEFFSRGLQNQLTGTMNWTTVETPFFLKKGENPDNVKLNLVIEGKGAAWIDDVRLLRATL
jgi:hypothetical protein